MKSFKSWVILLATGLLFPNIAAADFTFTSEQTLTTIGTHDGIAFDGTNWHITDEASGYRNYAADFTFIDSTSVTGVSQSRGLTYDSAVGSLFLGDFDSGIVREVTIAGTEIQQFAGGVVQLNGLAFDSSDDSIWLASFSGAVSHRTRTGTLIDSFAGATNWTDIAYDDFNDTLLLLASNDTLYEYQTDGTLIGIVIPTDMITSNGLGLAYDSSLGRIHVTSQFGIVTIFDDPARAAPATVPEPGSCSLMGALFGAIAIRRRRRVRHFC